MRGGTARIKGNLLPQICSRSFSGNLLKTPIVLSLGLNRPRRIAVGLEGQVEAVTGQRLRGHDGHEHKQSAVPLNELPDHAPGPRTGPEACCWPLKAEQGAER